MTNHTPRRGLRGVVRAVALVPALLVLAAAGPALAVPDQWAEVEDVSPLSFLLVVVLIPAGLFVVIGLLSYLPSMARGDTTYQPGLAWRNEPEWFGGPRGGLDAAQEPVAIESGEPAADRGGASARW